MISSVVPKHKAFSQISSNVAPSSSASQISKMKRLEDQLKKERSKRKKLESMVDELQSKADKL